MDMSLKNAFLGAGLANPALKAAADVQKTAQAAAGAKQDFGAVLDRTVQKTERPAQPAASTGTQAKPQQPKKMSVGTKQDGTADTAEEPVAEDGAETTVGIDGAVAEESECEENLSEMPAGEETTNEETMPEPMVKETAGGRTEAEEPVEEMVMNEAAQALEQIIQQIKDILGITDEDLSGAMEELGMQPYDLFNTDHMSQLVAVLSGEDSVMSLVANEDLYAALQDITETVDTQVSSLLDGTGLTDGELDEVLQKLQEMETQDPGTQNPQKQIQESKSPEILNQEVQKAENQNPEPQNLEDQTQETGADSYETAKEPVMKEQVVNEPVVIREDHTKSDAQPAKKYDTLPANQQEDPVEISTKPQTQNAEKDAKGSGEKESRNFGQNHTSQNVQNNLYETGEVTTAEGIEKFTSESTENIMRQLADMVKIVKNENLTEMELQLHPASLGTVNVSLTTKSGVVTAQFTTQNETVKAAIEAQATQLKANLEEQGVKVEAIEVSVESHQMERNLDKNGQEQQRQAQEQETERIQGMRRGRSRINLRAFTNGEELEGEMQGADDATRIAMEIMAANGNTMDLLV